MSRFASGTYDEFKAALVDLRRQGLTRLVLDLRGNPGGYLDRATRLADEFIAGSRKIVYTDGKGDQYDSQTYARVAGEFEEGPLVVLVDEGSASAAEVVAGALQDHDRAILVGRRTFGKGLVQQPIPLSDGGELRLTIARYYTPAGRSIQKPYGANYAEYSADVANRAAHGELQSADSIRFAKALRFRTDHGRPVYGGGGIMPDVFVPRDSLAHSAYYTALMAHGVPRAFALSFFQGHKEELMGLRFEQFNATFRISDAQLASLAAQAAQDGVSGDAGALRPCAPGCCATSSKPTSPAAPTARWPTTPCCATTTWSCNAPCTPWATAPPSWPCCGEVGAPRGIASIRAPPVIARRNDIPRIKRRQSFRSERPARCRPRNEGLCHTIWLVAEGGRIAALRCAALAMTGGALHSQ